MGKLPVKDLEQQILSKIDSIQLIISDVKLSKRAVVPNAFLDLLSDFYGEARSHLLSELDHIRSAGFDDEGEEITKLCLTYMALLRALHEEVLTFVDTTEFISVSNETLFALRNLVEKASKDSVELALVPTWEYSYTVYTYKDIYTKLADVFGLKVANNKRYPTWFVFLKFPNIEANNILLNCVFGHEIAHFKDYSDGISARLIRDIKIDEKEFNAYLEELLKGQIPKTRDNGGNKQLTFGDFVEKASVKQELYAHIHKVIENWLKEIVADLLALRTFGPAFFYSLIQSSMLLQILETYSDSHPASSWRLGYCLSELGNIGFMRDVNNPAIEKYLQDWANYLNEIHKEPTFPIHRVSFISLKKELEKIVDLVRVVSKPFTFNTKEYNESSQTIKADYLLKCIAPIAYWDEDQHNYFNNIYTMNAAWEVFLTDKARFYENFDIEDINDELKANDVLNRLTLKAIESSDILRLWQAS